MKENRWRILFYSLLPSIILWYGSSLFISKFYCELSPIEYFSFFCFWYFAIWWSIYFLSNHLKIFSLRTFLDLRAKSRWDASKKGNSNKVDDRKEKKIIKKSNSSIGTIGIFMAVIALMLDLVLSIKDEADTSYNHILYSLLFLLASFTIILMILSADILDTISNDFTQGKDSELNYREWFYRWVGAVWPKGGISYAYLAYASFSIFLVIAFAAFSPLLAIIGTSLYTYLSYPYLYGYKGIIKDCKVTEIEPSKKNIGISLFLLLFFVSCAIVLVILPDDINNNLLKAIGFSYGK